MFIEILFTILLFKGGVLIYAEHCIYIYIYIYIYTYVLVEHHSLKSNVTQSEHTLVQVYLSEFTKSVSFFDNMCPHSLLQNKNKKKYKIQWEIFSDMSWKKHFNNQLSRD